MVDSKETGKFIAECRKRKQLTQKQMGEKLNVTDRAVSKWETGRSFPDIGILDNLCKILDISVSDLLAGKKIEPERYQEETEKILIASISNSQLYGFQIALYILQFMGMVIFYIPFISKKDTFLPELNFINGLCWIVCLVILCCVGYLDKKIPGREFRTSNILMEGIVGGLYFIMLMGFNFYSSGGFEMMNEGRNEKISVIFVIVTGLIMVILIRIFFAKNRRQEINEWKRYRQ